MLRVEPAAANAVRTLGSFMMTPSTRCMAKLVCSSAVPTGSLTLTEKSPLSVWGMSSVPSSGTSRKLRAVIPSAPTSV